MKSKSRKSKMCTDKLHISPQSYDFLDYDVNKSPEFVGFYKTAAETTTILENCKSNETTNNIINNVVTSKRDHSPFKKKRKQELLDISQINIDASTLSSNAGASAHLNAKSIPNSNKKELTAKSANVKSIMKNSSFTEQIPDSPKSSKSSGKPKKRNKSVSFMLEDNEEVVIKRTKSDDSIQTKVTEHAKVNGKDKKKTIKKVKNSQQSEKENSLTNINKQNLEADDASVSVHDKKAAKSSRAKKVTESIAFPLSTENDMQNQEKRKKIKKPKKQKPEFNPQPTETEANKNPATSEIKSKKFKKKKTIKPVVSEAEEDNGEPISKSRKMDPKTAILEDLENLSIGDNAHTLTHLLDEMTVVDKDKKKKLRQKFNKKDKPKVSDKDNIEKSEEGKEKVKWNKRKWNKDKKGHLANDSLATTIVVENLPLKIMLTYKKLLSDHFVKYGLIKKIGIAEVYPTEESKPVFTTTINFYSDGAAKEALELDRTEFEGSRIRVRTPLPPTDTTVVVRSYAELTDQNISSAFLGVGKIRSIKHLVKGKKSMATAFVEFDGPEAVKCALKKMAGTKIGGKKVHVAKFEPRSKKKKVKDQKNDADSAADADSEDSND